MRGLRIANASASQPPAPRPSTAAARRVAPSGPSAWAGGQALGPGEERGQPVDQPGDRERRERDAEDGVRV